VGKSALTGLATVEVTTWVSKYVGGDGAGSRLFEEGFAPGETIGDLLRRFTERFPELDQALWQHGRHTLGEHIEVLVNDAVLGVSHELDSPLKGGERLTLLGQFMGGSAVVEPSTGRAVNLAPSPFQGEGRGEGRVPLHDQPRSLSLPGRGPG